MNESPIGQEERTPKSLQYYIRRTNPDNSFIDIAIPYHIENPYKYMLNYIAELPEHESSSYDLDARFDIVSVETKDDDVQEDN